MYVFTYINYLVKCRCITQFFDKCKLNVNLFLVSLGQGGEDPSEVVSLLKQCISQYYELSARSGEFDAFMLYR